MKYEKGECFQTGEVWLSPRGFYYRVLLVSDGIAHLRLGMRGTGRPRRRAWDAINGWTLQPHTAAE